MPECGGCTACCTLFPVKWLAKPANTPCRHCHGGCAIQDTKPAECSDFNCAYVQMSGDNPDMRPDRCGVVFEKLSDRIFLGTTIPGQRVTHHAHGQINSFLAQGFSVVMTSSQKIRDLYLIAQSHDEAAIRAEFTGILADHGYLRH